MYTLTSPHNDHSLDLNVPVEGFRDGWQEGLIETAMGMDPNRRAAYLDCLYSLRNASLLPAYLRSEPIARFQSQIRQVIAEVNKRLKDREGD